MKKIKLEKEGWNPIYIRQWDDGCFCGVWEILEHIYPSGDERWREIDSAYVERYLNNLPDDVHKKDIL